MYHKGTLPYFPMFTLYPNRSGVDVTFENKKQKTRASFLIRGYEYKDVGGKPEEIEEYVNTESSSLKVDTEGNIIEHFRPQYLWEDLFGNASIDKSLIIKWVDGPHNYDESDIIPSERLNVKALEGENRSERLNVKALEGENRRMWRFTNDTYLREKFGLNK